MLLTYERTHIPTGRIYTGQFSANHSPCFSDPDGFPARFLHKTMQGLVDRWNRQQPDTWRYRLILSTQGQAPCDSLKF